MLALTLTLCALAPLPVQPQEGGATRVPGDTWMRFDDVAQAGFDAGKLEAARRTWERLPSSAFMVVADGAVVAAWGDVERRFMCHSVRKSFLSALYGIYWDRGELELNKTLADLGLDDAPDPLLESEKRARILDLLKARSGVFHPAAYAGRTDSDVRGSQGPGRFFAYNNWDFNTLAHILREETGAGVFEAFDEHFAQPLGMQDYRVSDGYYHYERDKSLYPAYPFRMSARDAARFGLLFARLGDWGGRRILSRHWVRRSTALYSIDSDVMGYGFMWWVFREPRFERHGMVSALGVGNQMIAALPDSDLMIVNRANTYEGESTPLPALLDLIESVLEARTGVVAAAPRLVPLEEQPRDPRLTPVSREVTQRLVGTFPYPPEPLGLPQTGEVEVRLVGERLVARIDNWGTFDLYVQPDGTLLEEDSLQPRFGISAGPGGTFVVGVPATNAFAGLVRDRELQQATLLAAARGHAELARSTLHQLPLPELDVALTRVVLDALGGGFDTAAETARELIPRGEYGEVERFLNQAGYTLLNADEPDGALRLFELNVELFPDSSNAFDSLAEVHLELGNDEDALLFYELSLERDPENANAERMIARIREAAAR